MDIYLTNTLTRKKEKFGPTNGKKVNFFVCGPTVYDYSHLGHAKTYIQFDVIVRFLRFVGYEVFYLQNITDLDDKILARAKESKVEWKDLSRKFEKLYFADMERLNNTSVSKYARVTDYIPEIIKQVKSLMEKGYAYTIDDGVYFEIAKFPRYGELSGRTEIKGTDAQSRIDENRGKRGWNDFCLWKFSKPDEPSWEAEMGSGRPGWHIEDTAITEKFFGPQYDVHGGAVDLIIPHHEAEIAQMEAASGKSPLVKYWLHTAFLMVDGRKMSKSLGNFYTIDDVIKKGFDPLALRYLFLGAHYRDTINFTWESLTAAQNGLNRLRSYILDLRSSGQGALSQEKNQKVEEYRNKFTEAMNDDLNAPRALAVMWEMLKSNIPNEDKYDLAILFDEILGLKLQEIPNSKFQIPNNVKILMAKREKLRKEGKFEEADALRGKIDKLGFAVKDEKIVK